VPPFLSKLLKAIRMEQGAGNDRGKHLVDLGATIAAAASLSPSDMGA